jgi:hypothetical protein
MSHVLSSDTLTWQQQQHSIDAPFCFLTSPSTTLVISLTPMKICRSLAYFFHFLHILPDIIKVSSFGFHGNQYSTSLVKTVELQAQIPQESKLCITPQLTRKTRVNFQTKNKGRVCITGCDILPDGKLVFVDETGKRLLMFSISKGYLFLGRRTLVLLM